MRMNAHFMQINEYKKVQFFQFTASMLLRFRLHSLYLDLRLSLAPFFSKYDVC